MTVWSNLAALLKLFGSFPSSRYLELPGLVLFDGGTDSAYENYALPLPSARGLGPGGIKKLVGAGLDFFKLTGMPHIWPVFPGMPEIFGETLEDAGLRHDATFLGMSAPAGAISGVDAGEIGAAELAGADESDIRDWADAVWYGFDSGEPAPPSFARFAGEMASSDELSLYALKTHSGGGCFEIVSTGMLCSAGGAAGIYYVATRPEFRRRGLGLSVMRALMERGRDLGHDEICLLATPDGAPLYKKCGFVGTGEVRIYASL
jgi:ribosomal protein S18 acetylase RimI-like enzyme